MLQYILIGGLAVMAILLLIVAMQPADFRITRAATIQAPPAIVFAHLNDLHRWNAWSPWAKMDPNAKNSFSGPPEGPGATMAWEGNSKVGEGRMTIVSSKPAEEVQLKLEFLKPFAATNAALFTLAPAGEQTNVTWTMTGRNNFIGKAACLVMNCEKMVGGQFAEGLVNLNATVRPAPQS